MHFWLNKCAIIAPKSVQFAKFCIGETVYKINKYMIMGVTSGGAWMRRSERSRIQKARVVLWRVAVPYLLPTSLDFDSSTSLVGGNSLSSVGSEPVEARVSQQNRGLKCVSINTRSLVNKAPQWDDTNCYDITAVTDTWLDGSKLARAIINLAGMFKLIICNDDNSSFV